MLLELRFLFYRQFITGVFPAFRPCHFFLFFFLFLFTQLVEPSYALLYTAGRPFGNSFCRPVLHVRLYGRCRTIISSPRPRGKSCVERESPRATTHRKPTGPTSPRSLVPSGNGRSGPKLVFLIAPKNSRFRNASDSDGNNNAR